MAACTGFTAVGWKASSAEYGAAAFMLHIPLTTSPPDELTCIIVG
jgi:hypothetical protein